MALNDQRIRFAHEYVKDLNQTQAAIRAGYSEKTAHAIASKLIRDPEVWALVQGLTEDLLRSAHADSDRVLDAYTTRAFFDPADLFEQDGSLKLIGNIPIEVRQCIQSLEVTEIFDGQGDQKTAIGLLKKIKLTDRDKALESLAKYHGLLRDRTVLENPDGSPLAPPKIEIVLVKPEGA